MVVQAKTAWLYNDPSLTERYRQISFNTVLPLAAEDGDILTVATPADGFKWIDKKDVLIRGGEAGKAVTGQEVSELARQFFLGLPYLWAGTSGFGFDCSGFTYSLYAFMGFPFQETPKTRQSSAKKKSTHLGLVQEICYFTHARKEKGLFTMSPCISETAK